MATLQVQTSSAAYPIYIESGFEALPQAFETAALTGRKLFIITDSNVCELYLQEIQNYLATVGREVHSFVFPEGEAYKSLDTISEIYRAMMDKRLDRKSVVVALGGGVTGDIAGFAAATFMRGIPFVQVPTTLLAQVDSSVGGKVGVDFKGAKNLIGAFYQPAFVYTNVNTLHTLPEREYHSGLGEVIKHGLILDKKYYEYIHLHKNEIATREIDILTDIIKGSCCIKAAMVRKDEREEGQRALLNFGHTFGHAIESLSNFQLAHGLCVAMGSLAAMYLSKKYGKITAEELARCVALYSFFQMDTGLEGMDAEGLYNQMFFDKKAENNQLKFILLDGIGKAYIAEKDAVSKEDALEAFQYILK